MTTDAFSTAAQCDNRDKEIELASALLRGRTTTTEGLVLGPLLHLISTLNSEYAEEDVERVKHAAHLAAQMLMPDLAEAHGWTNDGEEKI